MSESERSAQNEGAQPSQVPNAPHDEGKGVANIGPGQEGHEEFGGCMPEGMLSQVRPLHGWSKGSVEAHFKCADDLLRRVPKEGTRYQPKRRSARRIDVSAVERRMLASRFFADRGVEYPSDAINRNDENSPAANFRAQAEEHKGTGGTGGTEGSGK